MKKSLIVVLLISFTAMISAASGCKKQAGPTVTPPAHVHDYGEWQTAEKATFEKDGLEERFCKGCNQRDTRVVPKKTEQTYTITYDLNGGTIDDEKFAEAPAAYKNTDDDIYISLRPYKRKFIFKGWSVAEEKPMKNYKIAGGTEGNLILFANYEADTSVYYDGGEIDVLPDVVSGYLTATNKAEYLYKNSGSSGDDVKSVKISWPKTGSAYYNFELSTDENFENAIYSEEGLTDSSLDLYNLVPDTYYYRVSDRTGEPVKDDSFKIANDIRTIYCGNIKNVRDMGGRETSDGKIKYGLIYRTPEIAVADDTAKRILADELGVKTEIDLRFESTTASISDKITKYKLGILQWDYIFPELNVSRPTEAQAIKNLKTIFELFADKRNYPIVFHCSAGADRTGTVAFLLNGLLGASYEDLAEDFEITSFYFGGRWRSHVTSVNGVYSFDDSGVMQDNSDNLIAFGRAYNHIMSTYGTDGGALSDAIANYLKTAVGLTDYDIYSIKHIMLGSSANSYGEHRYGEWKVVKAGSCLENGEKRRYCGCGLYESEAIETIGTHVYGDWEVVTDATTERDGLRKRYCACGDEQSEIIPKLTKTVYDFNGTDINADVTTDGINSFKASKVTDLSSVPSGYDGGVYYKTDGYLVCIGIGFNDRDYNLDDLREMKIRLMVVSNTKLPKGNVRIYDDTNNAIYADKNFDNDLSGVYNEWIEIDLLPLLKASAAMTDTLTENGVLKNFSLVIRTGVAATIYFDNVTVVSQ